MDSKGIIFQWNTRKLISFRGNDIEFLGILLSSKRGKEKFLQAFGLKKLSEDNILNEYEIKCLMVLDFLFGKG